MISNSFSSPKLKLLTLSLAAVLASCASKPENYQSISRSADPTAEIDTLKSEIESAKAEQTDVLAPEAFAKAIDEKEHAEKLRSANKDNEKVLDSVAKSKAYLTKAKQIAGISKASVQSVVDARQKALAADAPKSQDRDLKDADKDFTRFTKNVESGRISISAKEKASLEETYRAIELKAITYNYLNGAKHNIDTAKDEGAKSISPKMWKSANDKYATAEAKIMSDRYNDGAIRPLVEAANGDAGNLLVVTRTAKVAAKMSPEELALYQQKLAQEIASANQETAEQKQARLAQEAQLKDKTKQLSGYEKQAMVDQKIAELRKGFAPGEADVFKEGDNVLIRLKKISFKKNDAALRPEQLTVLSKIQSAVTEFAPQKVIVEGHTDSTGGAALNKSLSEERAKVVESYLVTNGAVTQDKIEAIGYGFEKPLASNKSAKGRAQNRRIDVIIEL